MIYMNGLNFCKVSYTFCINIVFKKVRLIKVLHTLYNDQEYETQGDREGERGTELKHRGHFLPLR